MSDPDREYDALVARIDALERTLTDGHGTQIAALRDAAALDHTVEELEGRLDDLESRLADVEAATQALRGYVGHLRHVNETVERRADAALAAVESRHGPPSDCERVTDGQLAYGEPEPDDSFEELSRLVDSVRDSL